MHRFRKILVGVNLSHADRLADSQWNSSSREALDRAIWLAARNSAELTIFSAVEISAHAQEMLHGRFEQVSHNVESESLRILDELVTRANESGIAARRQLAFGKPWEEIIRQVLRERHDLVIAGTREMGRGSRMLLGSTSLKLLHHCPCPVWLTKPSQEGAKPDEARNVLNVLVASDFSDVALDALQMGVNLGQLIDTRTHVLHSVEHDLDSRFWRAYLPEGEIEDYRRKLLNDAERSLHEQLSQTDYRTLKYGVKLHVVEGPPDERILEAVDEHAIDLLVMGTAARSGVSRLVVGNTAERVLARVSCSVLAVKPKGFVSSVIVD